jgi:hypothetical protein
MAAARELTPKDYVELTNALGVSLRLLLLDRVWTREAQRASGASREDARIDELDAVTSEMETLFSEVQTCASSVTDIAEQTGTLLQERFDDLLTKAPPRGLEAGRTEVIAKRLQHHVKEKAGGDTVTYLRNATSLIAERSDREVKAIKDELGKLRRADASDGDMSDETAEAVGAIALGAGLMLGPEAAGAVIVVAEIIDCLT